MMVVCTSVSGDEFQCLGGNSGGELPLPSGFLGASSRPLRIQCLFILFFECVILPSLSQWLPHGSSYDCFVPYSD